MGHRAFRSLLLGLALGSVAAPAAAHERDIHGDPRASLPDTLVTQPVEQAEATTLAPATPASSGGIPETWCGEPTTTDRAPEGGAVLKVVYAHASDQPDRSAELADRLQANASLLSRFIALQSGGRKTLRWDMGTSCGTQYVDIQVVHLPRTRAYYVPNGGPSYSAVVADASAQLAAQHGPRNWVIYADGMYGTNGVAGTAAMWDGRSAPDETIHDDGRLHAVVFGPQTLPAGAYAWPAVMLHEVAHNLGAVQRASPHATYYGHCKDEHDVMCYADSPNATMTYPCPKVDGIVDETFDCGGDDYFNPAPTPTSYLEYAWNVYDSAHLGLCSELLDACGLPGAPTDGTRPVDTTPRRGATTSTSEPYTVQLSGSDSESAIDAYAWRVDHGAIQYGQTATVTHGQTLYTKVRDAAGNWSRWRADEVMVDGYAPDLLVSCPSGVVRARSTSCLTQLDDEDDGATMVETQVNDGPVESRRASNVGSYWTIEVDGPISFRARAVDGAGNASPWQLFTFELERDIAWLELDCPVAWQSGPVECTVSGGDGDAQPAALTWRVDGGDEQSGPSASRVPVAGDGTHTVSAAVTTTGGETVTKSATVKIDSTPPIGVTVTCDAAWSWLWAFCQYTATDPESGAGVTIVLSGGRVDSRTTSTFRVLGDGEHTVRVRATNGAGLATTSAATVARVDTVAPTSELSCPAGWVAAASLECTVSGTDSISGVPEVFWRIGTDGPLERVPGASATISVTRQGETKLSAGAVDRAGLSASSDATVKLDSGDPDLAVDCPAGWSRDEVTCTITASDAVSGLHELSWRLDGGEERSGSSGSTVTVGAHGAHTIVATARDVAGRTATVSATARVDHTPPESSISCPGGWIRGPAQCTLGFSDPESGVASRLVRIDGGEATAADLTETVGEEGEHLVEAQAVNGAGESSAWASATARVDATPPALTVSCPEGWRDAASVTCTESASDALSGVTATEGAQLTVTAEGATAVVRRARDAAGNVSRDAVATARLDRTDPHVAIECPSGRQTEATSCVVGARDAGAGVDAVTWRVDGGEPHSGPPGSLVLVAAHGTHTIVARAVDGVGRSAEATAELRIDLEAPAAPVVPLGVPVPPPAPDDDSPHLPLPPADGLAARRVAIRTVDDRRLATATVARIAGGRTTIRVAPARLGAGRWRVRMCVGRRCSTRALRVRRGRRPRAVAATLPAVAGARARFVLQRRDGRGRFRAVARGAARIA